MVARPVDSAVVAARAPCRVKCSVVTKVTEAGRGSEPCAPSSSPALLPVIPPASALWSRCDYRSRSRHTDGSGYATSTCTAPVRAGRRLRSRSRIVLGGRKRMRNVPESGLRTRRMSEQSPPDSSGTCFSCHYLGQHLLGGELVPVGAARVLADGGDKLADLIVAGDPELNPARAAADVPGQRTSGESELKRDARLVPLHPGVVTGRQHMRVTRAEVVFAAVVHAGVEPPGDDVAGVGRLAGFRADDRLDVGRPLPTGLIHRAGDRDAGQVDHVERGVLARVPLIGRLDVLDCHD